MQFAIDLTHVTYIALEEVPRFKTEHLMYAETQNHRVCTETFADEKFQFLQSASIEILGYNDWKIVADVSLLGSVLLPSLGSSSHNVSPKSVFFVS